MKRMLGPPGIQSTSRHTMGCLTQQRGRLIIEPIDVMGIKVRGIIDTGATASFIPSKGVIIQHINPPLQPASAKLNTVGHTFSSLIHKTSLLIKPFSTNVHPIRAQALVINTGKDILGYDIVLRLPELEKLGAHIGFHNGNPLIQW